MESPCEVTSPEFQGGLSKLNCASRRQRWTSRITCGSEIEELGRLSVILQIQTQFRIDPFTFLVQLPREERYFHILPHPPYPRIGLFEIA